MRCEVCGEREGKPTYYIYNGNTRVRYLCPECNSNIIKSKLGGKPGVGFLNSFADFFDELPDYFGDFFNFEPDGQDEYINLKCPKCGTTSGEFLKTGFVGCSYCYTAFRPILKDVIKKCQRQGVHIGKTPDKTDNIVLRLKQLSEDLKRAVEDERYEDAALIKKEIDGIKGEKK